MSRETDIAWAAGLFEGEGCFSTSGSSGLTGCKPMAQLAMADEDIVRRFAAIIGIGTVYLKTSQDARWKAQWYWRTYGLVHVEAVYELLAPHLGERRRERAEELIALARTGRRHRARLQREEASLG